jgi:hypothetical protein
MAQGLFGQLSIRIPKQFDGVDAKYARSGSQLIHTRGGKISLS